MEVLGLISVNLSEPFFLHPYPHHNFLSHFLCRIEQLQGLQFVLSLENEGTLPIFLRRFVTRQRVPIIYRNMPQVHHQHFLEVLNDFGGQILVDLSAWHPFIDVQETQKLVDSLRRGNKDYFVPNGHSCLFPNILRKSALIYLNQQDHLKGIAETLRKSPLSPLSFDCSADMPASLSNSISLNLFIDSFHQLRMMEEIFAEGSFSAWMEKKGEKVPCTDVPVANDRFFIDFTKAAVPAPGVDGAFAEDCASYFTRQVTLHSKSMPYAFTPALDRPAEKPLMILFHGWGGSGKFHLRRSALKDWNILVPWDCNGFQRNGSYWLGENGDMITEGLLLTCIEVVRQEYGITNPQIFAVGGSMGGFGALYHGIKHGWQAVFALWPLIDMRRWQHDDLRLFESIVGSDPPPERIPSVARIAQVAASLPPIFLITQRFDFANPPELNLFKLLEVYNQRGGWYGLRVEPNIGHGCIAVSYDQDIIPFFKAVHHGSHLVHADTLDAYAQLLRQEGYR